MLYQITFYKGVEDRLLAMPPAILARLLRLFDAMRTSGGNLGEPHTKSLKHGLFEVRAKSRDGLGRALYCNRTFREVHVLHCFVKKSQQIPRTDIRLARTRMKEVIHT